MKARARKRTREPRNGRAVRRGILLGCFMAAGSVIVARAAQLQVAEHERWVAAAEDQHRERIELPPRRGGIYDRNGLPLALSHETFQVSVAPGELRDRREAIQALADGLGLSAAKINAELGSSRRWVVLSGRYSAEQRQKVGEIRGVYFERQFERFYPQGDAGREVIGAVTRDHRALGGIEQQLDSVLRGEPGYSILRRDAAGEAMAAISLPVVPPRDGASVYLTIDFDLQGIADAALREAMRTTGSRGGDLLIGDPRTGEILAAVSSRSGRTRSLTAITEPYEPGSTLKPFLVASLLSEGAAELTDSVYGEKGSWLDGSRTIRDTSPHEWLSLAGALEVSSNIAVVKFAKRLSPGQQYSYLRDFGFGTGTGIEYPAESFGRLRKPAEWSRLSSASLAMGYEVSVTPLQMLAAYGALANGGVLMKPYLVREIRSADGRVLERRGPTAIRRVVPEEVARAVTEVLTSVVEEGTATRAALATFSVAGKTGTSRRTSPSGGYVAGAYTSTFAGYFPAEDPQVVIFVKLDEPQGDYYGGLTAAPVTRATLQGILAARTEAIDGRTLLNTRLMDALPGRFPIPGVERRPSGGESGIGDIGAAPGSPDLAVLVDDANHAATATGVATGTRQAPASHVFDISAGLPTAPEVEETATEVPDLTGLDVREAVRRAHEAGLTVRLKGSGEIRGSSPPAGEQVAHGTVITLTAEGP